MFRRGFVIVGTCEIGEAYCEGRGPDLLGEKVLLVEEENDGSVGEPFVVADGIEKSHTLVHPVHLFVFCQHEVVGAQSHTKDNRRHPFKAVNPLLALAPLTSDVKHLEVEILECEIGLDNASRLHARA